MKAIVISSMMINTPLPRWNTTTYSCKPEVTVRPPKMTWIKNRKIPIEPNLNAKIFWDIDENGEHNESTEPNITTNKEGEFAFEWISDSFPVSIRIGCNLSENNNSGKDLLLPLFPPPPPPESIESVKNYYLNLPEAGV